MDLEGREDLGGIFPVQGLTTIPVSVSSNRWQEAIRYRVAGGITVMQTTWGEQNRDTAA